MSDWLHDLPWTALVMFGFTYLLAAAIHAGVAVLAAASGQSRFRRFLPACWRRSGLSLACSSPSPRRRSGAAVIGPARRQPRSQRIRSVMVLASSFGSEPETRLRGLVRAYIEEAASVEWPMMARQAASLKATPRQALQFVLSLTTAGPGQQTAQREIASALQTALDARRQRIIVSRAEVNLVKWFCLYPQAVCVLLAIAFVHCDNRPASAVATGLYATGIAASVLLIAAHDRPFTGQLSVTPEPLLQIMPDAPTDR